MLPHPNLLKKETTFVFTSNSDLKYLRGRKTLRMLGILLNTGPTVQGFKFGPIWYDCLGLWKFWIFDYTQIDTHTHTHTHTHTQTLANFIIR